MEFFSEKKLVDIDEAFKSAEEDLSEDASSLFAGDAEGYIINGGPYKVDEEVLLRLTELPVEGEGSVMWRGFKAFSDKDNPDPFDGVVPVSKLKDPVFMSVCLPSELNTYMHWRVNASNMNAAREDFRKLVAIGAIYKEKDTVLPDDAEITVCLGKITLLMNTEEDGWFVGNEMNHPAKPNRVFYLPWSLEKTLGALKLPDERLTEFDDRYEIRLSGAMLNGTYNVPEEYIDQVEGSVLHFWGTNWQGYGGNVRGCVAGYIGWIKEEEYVGKVVAAVGADWRTGEGKIAQAFSGKNYRLTTEPRVIFGHTVGPKNYDTVMDTELVQKHLGLK